LNLQNEPFSKYLSLRIEGDALLFEVNLYSMVFGHSQMEREISQMRRLALVAQPLTERPAFAKRTEKAWIVTTNTAQRARTK
jgi:hypothetical protein